MSKSFDIAIVGGGAAGIAAAVSAARAGCTTLLLDRRPAAGGTGGFSGLTTLCGLFDDEGEWLNDGFAREFGGKLAETPPVRMGKVWVLPYRPEAFRALAASLLGSTPNIHARWNTRLTDIVVESNRIIALNGIQVRAVIDCSGTAEVARVIGAACLATDETTQAPAVIFPLTHVRRELTTPASAMQVLLPLARAGLPPLSFQPNPEPGTVTVKLEGQPNQVPQVIEFLQTHVSGFEECRTTLTEFTAARRSGRMIVGRYVLTRADAPQAGNLTTAWRAARGPSSNGTPRENCACVICPKARITKSPSAASAPRERKIFSWPERSSARTSMASPARESWVAAWPLARRPGVLRQSGWPHQETHDAHF